MAPNLPLCYGDFARITYQRRREAMVPEDRLCPFKGECDPNCALYIGGAESVQGDCAFTWINRTLEKILNKLNNLPKIS
jgi:hypothetical protein